MTEYSKIVAVTGLPGLYELINSKTDGAIVRSLDDKSTKFISSRIYKLTQLETIEVFTVKDNVNLIEVFKGMDGSTEKLPDEKDNAALGKYFQQSFPDLDFEKVYASDMKKMVKWFSILKGNNIELKLSEPPESTPVPEAFEEEEKIVEKPVKAKKAEKTTKAEKTEKPEKKAAVKKETKSEKPAAKKKAKKEPEPEKKDKPKKPAAKSKSKK